MKAIEEYFENLAAAATNKKSFLEQIVANKSKLAAINEELVVIVKKNSNENKDLQRETYHLKKTGGSGAAQGNKDPTL